MEYNNVFMKNGTQNMVQKLFPDLILKNPN